MFPRTLALLCTGAAACSPLFDDVTASLGSGSGSDAGSGSGSGSGSDTCVIPELAVALAPTPLTTELRTTNHVSAIVSTQGFAGGTASVQLEAYDHTTHTLIPSWTITPAQTVALPGTGGTLVAFDVTIPSDSASLAADLHVRATTTTTSAEAVGTITVAKQITIEIPAGTGDTGTAHTGLGPDVLQVRAGTQLLFYNADSIAHVIHGDGGVLHEAIGTGAPGTIFAVTVNQSGDWYCHTHEYGAAYHPRYVTVVP